MIVEEMNILITVLLRYDSLKIIYPNSVLSTKPISSYYRSTDMRQAIEFNGRYGLHTMNLQDMGVKWAKTALLVEKMVRIFRELDIEYRMLPLDVNVLNMPQLSSSRVPSNWTLCA
ncbi:hypothetical protein R3W88_027901 [Solanum pinnatisectum]|uniref:Uncharacterized protein n=1 Tax=Solanum pinnatisectum TaxID=50273 RepID=A0AAV9LHB0_9SOLN|nr:hypothetical protein R3W88_027901 [Solanum pinnatisectum]